MFLLTILAALAAPLSPNDAVVAALASNPDIARADAERGAAQGAARQSAFLRENLSVEGGYALVGDRLDVTVSQPISVTGEGMADNRSARARLDAAKASVERARFVVAAEVRSAYVDAVVAHQRAALAGDAFELATRQLEVATARLKAGEASELELRLGRLERASAAQQLLDARRAEAEALASISTLAQRPVTGGDLDADPLAAAPAPLAGGEERSDVVAARLAVDAADAAVARERAAALPALAVGGFYESDAAGFVAGPSLGVTLPLWHQNQAGVSEASGAASVARAELAALQSEAEADVTTARALHTDADRVMAALGEGGTDDARAALAAIEAGFNAGELDLLQTVLLRGEVIAGQRAWVEARGAWAVARIQLLLATEDPALLGGGR